MAKTRLKVLKFGGSSVASSDRIRTVGRIVRQHYVKTPLLVQGPGAGADVTAMGVFSDILKLLHYLPK